MPSAPALCGLAAAAAAASVAVHTTRRRNRGAIAAPAYAAAATEAALDSVAFFFIKPGAVNDEVDTLVRARLADHGIRVLREGRLPGSALDKTIDRHYGTLAERALHVPPAALPEVSAAAQAAFADTFGIAWADALAQGRVLNLTEAKAAHVFAPGAPATEIEAAWRAGPCVKLFPGTYVARVPAAAAAAAPISADGHEGSKGAGNGDCGGRFVVNGFFAGMKELFVRAPAGVAWKEVAWSSAALSWADFRQRVVGATDPRKAHPASLRGELLARWRGLGLAAPPAGADNGFHASASPLEALYERAMWLCPPGSGVALSLPSAHTPLLDRLRAAGFAEPTTVEQLCGNPSFAGDGGAPVFDVVEHLDTAECARVLVERLHAEEQPAVE